MLHLKCSIHHVGTFCCIGKYRAFLEVARNTELLFAYKIRLQLQTLFVY